MPPATTTRQSACETEITRGGDEEHQVSQYQIHQFGRITARQSRTAMPAAIPITLDSPSSTGLGKFKLAVVLLRSLFSNRQQATGGSPYTRSSRRKKLRACGGACGGRVYRARGRRDRGEAHARTHAFPIHFPHAPRVRGGARQLAGAAGRTAGRPASR
jgi:hypothetical protein